jgi:hypothetical protein
MAFEDFPHHIQELLRRAKVLDEKNQVANMNVEKQTKFFMERDNQFTVEESEKL